MQGPMQGPMQDRILHGLRQRVAATTDGTSMPLVDDGAEGPMAGIKTGPWPVPPMNTLETGGLKP